MEFPRLPHLRESSDEGLFPWLDRALGEEERDWIARADYAEAVAENRAAIDAILATGRVPAPLDWIPREVLELTRWLEAESEPAVGEPAARTLEGRHSMRLFATASLLRSLGDDPLGVEAMSETLAGFLASAVALGPLVRRLALSFMVETLALIEANLHAEVETGVEATYGDAFEGCLTLEDPLLLAALPVLSCGLPKSVLSPAELAGITDLIHSWCRTLGVSGGAAEGDLDPGAFRKGMRNGLWGEILRTELVESQVAPPELRAWAAKALRAATAS